MTPATPLAIGSSSAASSPSLQHRTIPHSSLSSSLQSLLTLRTRADSALHSPALAYELSRGVSGPSAAVAREALGAVLDAVKEGFGGAKQSKEHEARAVFCHAWALSRVGEYDGSTTAELLARLNESLKLYQRVADLVELPAPPKLESVPSVTRPHTAGKGAGELPEVQGWVGEMLAEWARTQTTLAFSSLLDGEEGKTKVVEPEAFADLVEIACRRNVQALFTPLSPLSPPSESSSSASSTVLGNARLLRDILSLFPFHSLPTLWTRQLNWATHIADVRFVLASLSANALVDEAAAHAAVLASPSVSNARRKEVKVQLERLSRQIAPFERTQGNVLLWLGRVMLDGVGALYAGRTEGYQVERRKRDGGEVMGEDEEREEDEKDRVEVPENELVQETRQVLIRAAALFENAYASILRSPPTPSRRRTEHRLLRRLEATYIDLEALDTSSPSILQLKSERIERALFINEKLVELGEEYEEGDGEGSDHERAAEDREEEEGSEGSEGEEEERLARRLGGTRIA